MSLDQELKMKINADVAEQFNLKPDFEGFCEVGYWCKFYVFSCLVLDTIDSYRTDPKEYGEWRVTKQELETILEDAVDIYETSLNDMDEDFYFEDREHWEYTFKVLKKVKQILMEDETAKIYYCQY